MAKPDNQDPAKVPHDCGSTPPKSVAFQVLTDGRNEIIIEYRGQEYRLRATRNGGLILNK